MFMWQQRHLNEPPICTLRYDSLLHVCDMLVEARKTLNDGTKVTAVHRTLECEIFLVRKLVYKSNVALRNEKALQGLQKLARSLQRLVELRLPHLMSRLLQLWPSVLTMRHGVDVYLPSCQMLQFLLVRLVGCAVLLHQIVNYAALTFTAAMGQVTIGMQIKNMLVFAGTASRIWFLCRSMKKQTVEWYARLHPLLDILTPTKAIWLTDGFDFPMELGTWLGKELVKPNNMVQRQEPSDVHLRRYHSKPRVVDELTGAVQLDDCRAPSTVNHTDLEDVGEVVQRESALSEQPRSRKSAVTNGLGVSVEPMATRSSNQEMRVHELPQSTRGESSITKIKPFCYKLWSDKAELCDTTSDLVELLEYFQEQYGIKSKKCKKCHRELKKTKLDTSKKAVMKCLGKVARFQMEKKRMDVLKFPVLLETLELILLNPGGLCEALRDVKEGGIKRDELSKWDIPPKALPRVRKALRMCAKRTKGESKSVIMAVTLNTAKKLARLMAGPAVGSSGKPMTGVPGKGRVKGKEHGDVNSRQTNGVIGVQSDVAHRKKEARPQTRNVGSTRKGKNRKSPRARPKLK